MNEAQGERARERKTGREKEGIQKKQRSTVRECEEKEIHHSFRILPIYPGSVYMK